MEAIETEATETEAWRSKRVELFTQKSSGAIGVTLSLIGYSLPKAHKQPAYFPGSLKSKIQHTETAGGSGNLTIAFDESSNRKSIE